jgi:PAS domain S-box-containing protein
MVLNYRDVTERKRIEVALIKSEADYRSTFESAPIGIAHTRLDGRWLRANERLRSLLGYSEQELQSMDFPAITHPDDVESNTEARQQLLAGAISRYAVEKRYRRADGDYVWVNLTVSLDRDELGEPKHFIATVEDISARKLAQQELGHIFDLSPDMICTSNFEGYFTKTNPAFAQTLGYGGAELETSPFISFVHQDDQADTLKELSRLADGETTFGFTNRYRTASGAYRWIEWHAKADTDARLIYAVARDQTDKRLLEEQFRQAQKMEAVGRLAGGVAHDFNNLLTVILGFAEMSMESLAEDDPLRNDIQQIQLAGHSATALTKQLLAFSRRQILAPQVLDLNALVTAMLPMLRRLIGEDLTLESALDPSLLRISADPGQVEQVIMNLAVNARDAMPMGGRLLVETNMAEVDEVFVALQPGATPGHHVRLSLTDTGVGMDAGVLAHLFEPFFTTKEQGKGTGLGLATVYGIVEQSGGHVWVKSVLGQGTTFSIDFPSVQAAATTAAKATRPSVLTGTETVLVVEDQPEVRQVIKSVLLRNGYTVIEAADGPAALELLAGRHDVVDLLLTDVVMPMMSGRELVSRLGNRQHGIRVLYMSGYTDAEIVKHGILDPGIDFLPKPFLSKDLLLRVRAALDRRAAARPS